QTLEVRQQTLEVRQQTLEVRQQTLEQRPSPAQQLDDVLSRHHHALNLKVDATLQALLQRVERAERQLGQATVQASRPLAASRILSAAKLAEHMARPQGLWLELGCGEHPDPERINVDLRPLPGVDIVADVTQLPLPDASVADLRAAHLVEHFTAQHFVTRVLPEWYRVLAPGAVLRLITPDLSAMLQAHLRGELSEPDLVHVLYGGQDYEGDFHYHAYSPDALAALLRAHGFGSIDIVAQGRRNGLCLEFELIARKTTPALA
ncbi:MAG: methyltransferase domain-containing protein, partial [Tepidimonas sp.]|uniref:class I SAM-dependent methyltransferase n=1 Tax=Tepidimonas sp. TaxID=2002775 RepID=UPI00298F2C72